MPVTADLGPHAGDASQLDQLGQARRVVVDQLTTTIVGGRGDPDGDPAAHRGSSAPSSRSRGQTHFDKGKLRERLARLVGGVAVIKVGAPTETELRERRHRVEDAVQATRAARTEGILPGGGVALLNAQAAIDAAGLDAGRGDRRRDRAPRARGAAAPDRPQRRASSPRSWSRACAAFGPREGLDAATGDYCDLVRGGRDRPDDGHAVRRSSTPRRWPRTC